jgi:hypothetical protein
MTGSSFIPSWQKLWSNGNSVRQKMPCTTGLEFFGIANAIGKERTKSYQFIGAESIPERELEAGFNQASYIFAVDFAGGKIRKVK